MSAGILESFAGDDLEPKGNAVKDHRKVLEDPARRAAQERLARYYMRLSREELAKAKTLDAAAFTLEKQIAQATDDLHLADHAGDAAFGAAAIARGETAVAEMGGTPHELRERSQFHQNESYRYRTAAESVRICGESLIGRRAMDECKAAPIVCTCNRIGCELCARTRSSKLTAEWAPRLADLSDMRVLMLSIPNVRRGRLLDGHDLLAKAITIFRKMPWFAARWDGGVFAHEVTLGRPPKHLWKRDASGKPIEPRAGEWWHPHVHGIVGNAERELPDGVRFDWQDLRDCWSEAVAQAQDPTRKKTQRIWARIDALRARLADDVGNYGRERQVRREKTQLARLLETAPPRPKKARELNVWIDEPFAQVKHGDEWVKLYERNCKTAGERETVRRAVVREAMKYISKGIPAMPISAACELIRAKECRRWLQGFGSLHAQGVRGCRECRQSSCPTCHGKKWRISENELGDLCPCCRREGETERELEQDEAAACEHGCPFDQIEVSKPAWEEWAALHPVGLFRPRKPRGPPDPGLFGESFEDPF